MSDKELKQTEQNLMLGTVSFVDDTYLRQVWNEMKRRGLK